MRRKEIGRKRLHSLQESLTQINWDLNAIFFVFTLEMLYCTGFKSINNDLLIYTGIL